MKFSIVIPTYNGADFVEQAILSVINQTRKADEIIISDDNSSDDTLEICHKYGDIVSIFKNESGPSGFVNGWNNAIKHANSEYVSILHQDDCLKPTFLEEVENALKDNTGIKHVFASCEYIDENGYVTSTAAITDGLIKVYSGTEYIKAYQQIGHPHIHRCPGVVTHKDIFKVCKYRTEAGHIADDDFFYRVAQYTNVLGIHKPLAQYRQHGKSETGHLGGINLIQRLIHDYSFQLQHLNENIAFDEECKWYIRNWLIKVIEMELVHSLRNNCKNVYDEYLRDVNILKEYGLQKSNKTKVFELCAKAFGFALAQKIIRGLYLIAK